MKIENSSNRTFILSLLISIALGFSLIFVLLFSPLNVVSAQSTSAPSPDAVKEAYNDICKGLEDIKTDNSKKQFAKYCKKKPTKLESQKKAVTTICKSYGSNRLEAECGKFKALFISTTAADFFDTGDDTNGQCGTGENAVKTKFNFGCVGAQYEQEGKTIGTIQDMVFAVIRFLSAGVGILVVGSIIWAGIQYSSSQGNPEQTQAAKNRIQNSVVGLILYMFIFALIQYLVPGGLLT